MKTINTTTRSARWVRLKCDKNLEIAKLDSTEGIVKERLWASIAKICWYHFFTIDEFITNIIEYGSKSTENWYHSLLILQNIPVEIEYVG